MADQDATVAVITGAGEICGAWRLTSAEAESLVAGDPDRAAAVIRIEALLSGLYSDPLAQLWMTVPNRNPRIGGGRPVDLAIRDPGGLWDVLALLEGYAQGM